jgi:uncharacterized protein YjbI with pentapeptide repeats
MVDDIYDESFSKLDEQKIYSSDKFDGCEFNHLSFQNKNLSSKSFLSCKFIGCDFTLSKLISTRFRDCEFIECKLSGVDWVSMGSLESLVFQSSILDMSQFVQLDLRRSKFHKCSMKECHFSDTDLSYSDFDGSNLRGTLFHQSNLSNCNFQNSIDYIINPATNKIKGSIFNYPAAMGLLEGFDIKII